MSKKHGGYVFIPIKPETRAKLISLKFYGDTYDTVIWELIEARQEKMILDIVEQNVDDPGDENG